MKVFNREEKETIGYGKRTIALLMTVIYFATMSPAIMFADNVVSNVHSSAVVVAEKINSKKTEPAIKTTTKKLSQTSVSVTEKTEQAPETKSESVVEVLPLEAKELITREKGGTVKLGRVQIDIPAGAVKEDTEISITRLSVVNETGELLKNVTELSGGYRFLPAGTKFEKQVVVSIPYSKELNMTEAELRDMCTYFYDTEKEKWVKLERKELDKENGILRSYTTHFTDMINATLTVPETAGPVDFNINSLKNLEAARPDSHLIKFNPPKASNTGDASFSFELQIPQGRNGMQPAVSISYSTGIGNGIMGRGFDVNYGSLITTDTRKKLPDYKKHDTYMKDGVLLKLDINTETDSYQLYTPERETSFEKIERFMNNSNSEKHDYWKVTNKLGIITYYGEYVETSNKSNKSGSQPYTGENESKKFSWYPTETVDLNGNTIVYHYIKDCGYVYPDKITYTGKNKKEGTYFVKFIYDKTINQTSGKYGDNFTRKDVRVEARSKEIIECRKILTQITSGRKNTETRTYDFIYGERFNEESFVKEFRVWNSGRKEYYSYNFDYNELEVASKNENGPTIYKLFDEAINLNGAYETSRNTSSTTGSSGNGSAGVGFGTSAVDGRITGGVSGGSSTGISYTNTTVADMNGDGIPDVVAQSGTKIKIYLGKSNGMGFNTEPDAEYSIGVLLDKETSKSSSVTGNVYGGAGLAIGVSAGYSYAHTFQSGTSESTTALMDIDGDGRPDIITGNGKYLRNISNGTTIAFEECNIKQASSYSNYEISPEMKRKYSISYPMQRPFRVWRSKYEGEVQLTSKLDSSNVNGYIYNKDLSINGKDCAAKYSVKSGEYFYMVPDPKDENKSKDCIWNVTFNYLKIKPYKQRQNYVGEIILPETVPAVVETINETTKKYSINEEVMGKDITDLVKDCYEYNSELEKYVLKSNWKKNLPEIKKTELKLFFDGCYVIPYIITKDEFEKIWPAKKITKSEAYIMYGNYFYDITSGVYRLQTDKKEVLQEISTCLKSKSSNLDIKEFLSNHLIVAGLVPEYVLTDGYIQALYSMKDSKQYEARGKNLSGTLSIEKKVLKETDSKGTEKETVSYEKHIYLADAIPDKINKEVTEFSEIILDDSGKIRVKLSNDNYTVKKQEVSKDGSIIIELKDKYSQNILTYTLSKNQNPVVNISEEEMLAAYGFVTDEINLDTITGLISAATTRENRNEQSPLIFIDDINYVLKPLVDGKYLSSTEKNDFISEVYDLNQTNKTYSLKQRISDPETEIFNTCINAYKKYYFDIYIASYYSQETDKNWILKDEYRKVTNLNEQKIKTLQSNLAATNIGLYTQIDRSLQYLNDGLYDVINTSTRHLCLDSQKLWIVQSFDWKKMEYNSKTDFNNFNNYRIEETVWTTEPTESDKQEIQKNYEEILFGGENGWFFGIWQGTEDENPFTESKLKIADYSSYKDKEYNSSDNKDKAKYVEDSVEKKDERDKLLDDNQYNLSFYYPIVNSDSSIKKDNEAVKDFDIKPEALIGIVSKATIRQEEDVEGHIVTNEKTVTYAPYIQNDNIHCNRLGGTTYYTIEGIGANSDGQNLVIRKSRNTSEEDSYGPNVGFPLGGVSGTKSKNTGSSYMVQSLQDVNGDRIPDIIYTSYTYSLGIPVSSAVKMRKGIILDDYTLTFGNEEELKDIKNISYSNNESTSTGITFDPSGCIQKIFNAKGNLKGASLSSGTGNSNGDGTNTQTTGFMDINGDGLADYIEGDKIKLSCGDSYKDYPIGYANKIPLQNSKLITSGNSLSAGFGAQLTPEPEEVLTLAEQFEKFKTNLTDPKNYSADESSQKISCSVSANITGSCSTSTTLVNEMYLDVNGDGLQDIVSVDNKILSVKFNTGIAFTEPVLFELPTWFENNTSVLSDSREQYLESSTSATVSTNLGFGLSVNISIPIPLSPFSVNVTVSGGGGGNSGTTVSLSEQKMMDIDGDGFIDQVCSYGNGVVRYKKNRTGEVGLIKSITLPQGGSIDMSYEPAYGTVDMPQFKYLMTKVTMSDGNGKTVPSISFDDNEETVHSFTTKYSYSVPKYNREEKEFYGFRNVTETNPDNTYTETVYNNDTEKYYLKGTVAKTTSKSGNNEKYNLSKDYVMSESETTYGLTEPYALPTAETSRIFEKNDTSVFIENITKYEYDGDGNVIKISQTANDDSKPVYALIEYNQKDDNKYILSNPTAIQVYDHDPSSFADTDYLRKRTGTYDEKGRLESLTQYAKNSDDSKMTTLLTYDDYGNIITVTNPAGVKLQYEYYSYFENSDDENYQFIKNIKQVGTNLKSYVSELKYDFDTQTKSVETDANGNSLEYEYDDWQRISAIKTPKDKGDSKAISYLYSTPETVKSEDGTYEKHEFWYAKTQNKFNFDDERVIETVVQIDGLGKTFRTAKTGLKWNPDYSKTEQGWNVSGAQITDEKGRTVTAGQTYFEEELNLTGDVKLKMLYPTKTKYDEKDRDIVTTALFRESKDKASEYIETRKDYYITDNNQIKTVVTDPKGIKSTQITDAKGNIIYVEKYGKKTEDSASEEILTSASYEYNAMGEMLRAYDITKKYPIEVVYDLLGRKIELSSIDGGTYYYEYDGKGNLSSETNSKLLLTAKRINYIYDEFNRVSKIVYPDTEDTVYEYADSSAKGNGLNQVGRLVKITDASGTIEYEYGELGETTKESRSLTQRNNPNAKPITAVMEYKSNYLGQMESIVYPDGDEIVYTYDEAGQIIGVKGKYGTFVQNIGYDEAGQRIYIKYGNGVETKYEYTPETRLLSCISTKNERGREYQNILYTFDKVGNVKGYTNNCLQNGNYTTSQSYKYDGLNQLINVKGNTILNKYGMDVGATYESSYAQSFSFDILGNMQNKKSSEVLTLGSKTGDDLNYDFTYTRDENYAHRFTNIGNRYYKYDEVGNITAEKEGKFDEETETYSAISRIDDGVYGTEGSWGYKEESSGQTDNNKKATYLRNYTWNEKNQLIESSDNTITVKFVYGQDGMRSNKYTDKTETMYYNNFWTYYMDGTTSFGGASVSKHVFLGETRLATVINDYNNIENVHGYEKDHTYFYHADHLGSAQLVTDNDGDEYQRIEYTPYGESWVDIKIGGLKELTPISYKFTAKERDDETGLYYYGARYLDPKYSMWISTDPALGEYIPKAPTDDEAKKYNQNLPGMGGVYNHINFHLYHYAGNNPVRYTDPDGRSEISSACISSFKVNPWERKTITTIWADYKNLSLNDAYIFSGLMNEYRYNEKSNVFNQLADSWDSANSTVNDLLTVAALAGIGGISAEGALLLTVISKGLEGLKQKQYEKAADLMGDFTSSIKNKLENGYVLQDLNCSYYSKSTKTESRYPNNPSYSGTKTSYKINFYAHLIDESKPEDDPNRVVFISRVVEFEQ